MKMLLMTLLALVSLTANAAGLNSRDKVVGDCDETARPTVEIKTQAADLTDAEKEKYKDSSIADGDEFRLMIEATSDSALYLATMGGQKIFLAPIDPQTLVDLKEGVNQTRIVVGGWDESDAGADSQYPIFRVHHVINENLRK